MRRQTRSKPADDLKALKSKGTSVSNVTGAVQYMRSSNDRPNSTQQPQLPSLDDRDEERIIAQDVLATSSNLEATGAKPFTESTPLARPRRKPKLPKVALATAKPSSSLPPSSPLPPTSDDRPILVVQPKELDWLDEQEEEDAVDDPFGFLAAERKLKKKRELMGGPHKAASWTKPEPPDGVYGMPAEEVGDDLYANEEVEAFAEVDGDQDGGDIEHSTPRPPATPHKRAVKRRSVDTPSSSGLHTPHTGSMPSSPSPSKMNRSADLSNLSPNISLAGRKSAGKQVRKKSRTVPEQQEYDQIIEPEEHTKRLERLLPKRNLRRNAIESINNTRGGRGRMSTRRGSVRTTDTDTESESRKRVGRKLSAKARGKRKATQTKPKPESIDMERDDSEGRQVRLDYFKKLEGYELHKENVYVV
ncbi:hypothetical protein GLOTRDRAFT_138887 [Gloeophyllum trabeum ATCC 11539]|uniref:Uncharacterized protein n=1 Tax=Gloeophyllum trabeum (strain ATCC 11539 / FP-39264 / Madison 617) TaxID=670483 RepID=S7RQV4_GLOTA|nr:uncharacterized protein GLOTRDRAFT_138887 [Gloeophyllum trabeum ATCC 11539]EPQ55294.1 hypothetical protein GLOTRDRAFT_138887 [Gloeophyllum trabeum ATCC 11539]